MRELISYKPPLLPSPPVKKTMFSGSLFLNLFCCFIIYSHGLAKKAAKAGTAAGVTATTTAKTRSI